MSKKWGKEANACDEFVLSAYKNYSVDTVAELLLPTGLLIDKSARYAGTFEEYVFLHGNNDEVYSKQEIDFISATSDITIFTEFFKKTKRGIILCRVVAVRNTGFDTLGFSIAFTKIINKSSDGFNICVVVSEDGIIFTCRAYDNSTPNNYYISDIITTEEQMEELCDELMYSPDYTGFIEYYSYVRESIQFKKNPTDYLSKIKNARRVPYLYIEELQGLESDVKLSFSGEIEKSFWGLEEEYRETFANRVAEADECLIKIESSRINTMEMLFEAEEMERLASEAEQRNEIMLMKKAADEDASSEIDMETKALLEDPESMIKFLKKKRGI